MPCVNFKERITILYYYFQKKLIYDIKKIDISKKKIRVKCFVFNVIKHKSLIR